MVLGQNVCLSWCDYVAGSRWIYPSCYGEQWNKNSKTINYNSNNWISDCRMLKFKNSFICWSSSFCIRCRFSGSLSVVGRSLIWKCQSKRAYDGYYTSVGSTCSGNGTMFLCNFILAFWIKEPGLFSRRLVSSDFFHLKFLNIQEYPWKSITYIVGGICLLLPFKLLSILQKIEAKKEAKQDWVIIHDAFKTSLYLLYLIPY